MKVTATQEEQRFVAQAARDYYQAAVAVDGYQKAVLRTLHEVTSEFESKLSSLGLPFADARETRNLAPNPWMERKISLDHMEAGVWVMWFDPDKPEVLRKPVCICWWIRLRDRAKREMLGLRIRNASGKPFDCESSSDGTYIRFYVPLTQSARIKEHARTCTKEFVRVLAGSHNLLAGPKRTQNAKRRTAR